MVKVLDIVSVYGVVNVWEFLRFGSRFREGGFGGNGGGGEGGSRGAGGVGDGELSRLA